MTATNPFETAYRKAGVPADMAAEGIPPAVTSFEEEYRASTSAAIAIARLERGAIRVVGRDGVSFLHNMLSNDVRALAVSSGIPAVFLTNKGKLISDLLVFRDEDFLLLEMEASRREILQKALDRYVISENVRFEDITFEEARFSLEGPRASGILAEILEGPPQALEELGHLQFLRLDAAGVPVRVTAQRRELTPRFDVAAPEEPAVELLSRLVDRGVALGGALVAEARRIEAGRPRFGIDMDESHFPQEAGLDEAISFSKGCYIGQEYVVRLAHRGHLNRKLMGIRLQGMRMAPTGARVHAAGAEAGIVTSSSRSPSLACALALAHLRRGAFEPGTEVEVESPEGLLKGTVSNLPFTVPE